jgi:hypothetical protein
MLTPRGRPGRTEEQEQMTAVSHQTIKLGKGKHSSPSNGACVMELASMLAGEPFADHPRSVCPVIGSFLRAYNDALDDCRRQDLYAYAAAVVGSRSSQAVERARADRLAEWAAHAATWRRFSRVLSRPLRATRIARRPPASALGAHAVRAIRRHNDETHAAALMLVDELLAIGGEPRSAPEPVPVSPPDPAPSPIA